MAKPASTRIADRLAGRHILVTGSTGFLAKVFVEKLLRSVENIGGIHLLVRSRSGGLTATSRVRRDVLGSRAFDRLRARHGEGFEKLCADKIHVVDGDLTRARFGLSESEYKALADRIDLVVNSAATVTFDEQVDLAVELNTLGPKRLLDFARDCGNAPFMHVSTCYVCGVRTGEVVEDFSAPEPARESLPRTDAGDFDLDGLIDAYKEQAKSIKKSLGAGTETCRRELIDLGMREARRHGWNDTYTHTKWIGEQLLVRDHGDVPLVIFRPAIIEGSYDEPAPGWIDGLRMADPIIVGYGKGKLQEFPGRADVAIDMIPVDFVANAMIATLPDRESPTDRVPVYQCASSGSNPCLVGDMVTPLRRAYVKRPMYSDDGKPISVRNMVLVDRQRFIARWKKRRQNLEWLQKVYQSVGIKGRRVRRLSAQARQIEQVIYFAKIYSPYTNLDCRFMEDNLREVRESLHPDDREVFPFDPKVIDWADYLINRHVPGIRSFVLGTGSAPARRRIRAVPDVEQQDRQTSMEVLASDNLFEVFENAARAYGDKPALQIKRGPRWVRYSYEDALAASGAVMQRLTERGCVPGDRVALLSESSPEWCLAYMGMMRAGLTAVPLDPQLPPEEAWEASRFAGAKLMVVSRSRHAALRKARGEGDPALVQLNEAFVPPPGASRDISPSPVPIEVGQAASILFTSGTTVQAKSVPLTHGNLISNARALLQVHRLFPSDELLSVLPMYHAFEFTGGFLCPFASGATITYIAEMKGQEIRNAMKATGTTVMLVVPRLLQSFLDAIEMQMSAVVLGRSAYRLAGFFSEMGGLGFGRLLFTPIHNRFGGHVRMFVSGGSRLEPALWKSFERMGFPVYEGYGLTETSPVLSVNPPGAGRPGTVGKMLPNVELEIRNQNLEGVGEIWVKGPSVMSAYCDNEEATRDVVVDGWFNTGDLGKLDEMGYLTITGRSKDLIVTSAGKNVYPDEVEFRYRDLPYVKEMCVFGMSADDGVGDTVHAVVVLDAGQLRDIDMSSAEREVRMAAEAVSEELPAHQRITTLHFWEHELPRTSTMKAKRGLVRERVLQDRSGGASTSRVTAGHDAGPPPAYERTTFPVVRRILSQQTKRSEKQITRNAHLLLDLGIDSIGKINVIGEIETQFSMEIDDETATKASRVCDLLAIVGDRQPTPGKKRDPSRWRKRIAGEKAATVGTNGQLPPHLMPIRWVLRGGVGLFMKTYVRVRAIGLSNIPAKGAFILAPNHSSHLDSPSVLEAVSSRRRVWVAGAQDYFFNTAVKRFVFGKVLDTIAFDRKSDGVEGLRRCGDALRRGDGLLIFPEGTRSLSGEMQPFRIGVSVLAVERSVPIIPVHIDRTHELFPKGGRFIHPGLVTVRFGAPISPPSMSGDDDHYEAFREVTEKLEEAVRSLAREAAS